ncbi:MAG: Holliday junction branch migration protein RuvA [Deltaproteobacteria bacterium]|nr:Holliday junction branch migration protein RuvA [Deltaproteobacteria bacterium]
MSEKRIDSIVVDVNGIGFELFVTATTYKDMPDEGGQVTVHIYTQVRDDDIFLYGFSTLREKELFKLLISVSGIGPKIARNILSGIQAEELINAIVSKDIARLSSVPGLGKKGAEKIVVEIREKIGNLQHTAQTLDTQTMFSDAVSALVNLGYKYQQAQIAVQSVLKEHLNSKIEGIIKLSLKELSK